jgi:phosphatidylglycerophosphate synthase
VGSMDGRNDPRMTELSTPMPARVPRLAWLPDALTMARLAAIPVLWVLALLRMPEPLAIGATAAAITDVLDGMLARRLGVTSKRGGALDSLADHLLSTSLVAWLFLFCPRFFAVEGVGLLVWAGFALVVLAVGWMRFRQVGNLHLYSAKAAGVAGYGFGLLLLYTGDYSRPVWFVVLGMAYLGGIESLAVILTRRGVRDHRGSILLPRRD